MPSFTVESVVGQEEWSGDRGPMVTYELMLADEPQTVKLTRQAKSSAPSPGDTLDGTITAGKLKLDYAGGGERRSGGGSGGGYNDPKTVARISRSHSQEMALRLVFASGDAATLDLSSRETVGNYLNNVVKPITDWFDRDKAAAGDAAS